MLRTVIWKVRGLFRRRTDFDFSTEIETHVALLTERYTKQGMPSADAAAAARRKFGNATLLQEDRRAMQTFPKFEEVWLDLRYASRILRKSPSFTAAVVLTLALSIGANTAIFSVVRGVLLRPLPYGQPDRLVFLQERWLPRFPSFEATPHDFQAWQERTRAFEQIAAFANMGFTLTGGDRPERISGARVSANLPSLLGVSPILGRGFHADDDRAGSDRVVLIGYGLWLRRFAGDPQVIGRVLSLNNIDFTVVGVMPQTFRFPQEAEIWKPMGFSDEDKSKGHFVWAVGRLKPGVTRGQAQAELDIIMQQVSPVWRAAAIPLLDHYVGDTRSPLFVLMGAAGFVLMIACANVANLQLARNSVRQNEISLRRSLGATRGRVVRQLIAESVLLAANGGGLAVLVGFAGIGALKKFVPTGVPRMDQVGLDARTLLFTFGLSVLAALLFGILPALRLSDVDLQSHLTTGNRAVGPSRGRLRYVFMISETALALVLLAGAGLVLKSFSLLVHVPPGFQTERLLAASVNLPSAKYQRADQRAEFATRLLEKLDGVPEIQQVAISTYLPFRGIQDVGIHFDQPPDAAVPGTTANYYAVSASYLRQ